jgi:hypothetical protein
MGVAAYEISGHGKEWRSTRWTPKNVHETKAFEAAVTAATLALRQGPCGISAPASDTANAPAI